MTIKRHCQFLLDTEKDRSDFKIRYRIKWNSNTSIVSFSIGYRAEVDKWSKDTQRCKNNTTHGKKKIPANIINKEIQQYEAVAEEVFRHFELLNVMPKKDDFKREFIKRINKDKFNAGDNELSFFDYFDRFIQTHKISIERKEHFKVVYRLLKKFELYKSIKQKGFSLSFNNIDVDILSEIEQFCRNEHLIYNQYPKIYEVYQEGNRPMKRGQNTINGILVKIRTFFNWAKVRKITTNYPFADFSIKESIYGTPIYITIQERDTIYKHDFSYNKEYEIVRDIFIFHCYIGCRVADLFRLQKGNIINDSIEYIAGKTKDGRPNTVRVPLSDTAKKIVKKYDHLKNIILPKITLNQYNDLIKKIFLEAGIIRNVVTLDTITREQTIVPICEKASSHMARRTFIGNLYKQVKDPNLIGSLSGHKEGSKAFARYREIDDEMKKELIDLLK